MSYEQKVVVCCILWMLSGWVVLYFKIRLCGGLRNMFAGGLDRRYRQANIAFLRGDIKRLEAIARQVPIPAEDIPIFLTALYFLLCLFLYGIFGLATLPALLGR